MGLETGTALSLPSPNRSSASAQGWDACAAVSSAPIEAQTLELSYSEELDIVSVDARDTEDSPPQSRAYEELVEVVTRAVDWPAEREDVRKKKRRTLHAFLCTTSMPGTAVFFLIFTPMFEIVGETGFLVFIVHKYLTIPL